jgi:hypothetical protein
MARSCQIQLTCSKGVKTIIKSISAKQRAHRPRESSTSIESSWRDWLQVTTDARPASVAVVRQQRYALR